MRLQSRSWHSKAWSGKRGNRAAHATQSGLPQRPKLGAPRLKHSYRQFSGKSSLLSGRKSAYRPVQIPRGPALPKTEETLDLNHLDSCCAVNKDGAMYQCSSM